MSRKRSKGTPSPPPTPPPPPPIAPLKRSSTLPAMNISPSPTKTEATETGSGATALGSQKPALAPKPSHNRFMRVISGSLTMKRRKSSGKKEDQEKSTDTDEQISVTTQPIKEEAGEAPESATRDDSLERSGAESETKAKERGGTDHEIATTSLEMSRDTRDGVLLTPKQETQSATPKRDKKEKKKEKKGSRKVSESKNPIGSQQLREATLWKLPGIERVQGRRHSTGGDTHEISGPILQFSSNPHIESTSKSGSQPDLPSLPESGVPIRSLPEVPPDLPASLPDLPESVNASTTPPPSTAMSQGSLTNSTGLLSTPLKERKTSHTSQSSLSLSSHDQRYTPPQDDSSQAVAEQGVVAKPEYLSIGKMVEIYSDSFPLRIKVLQGYCSENSQVNISTNDVYTLHFIKHTKIVKVRDEDGDTFSIPLGTGMKFGLIYKPRQDLDEALTGFEFEKVSDLLAMPSLPKVVCVTKAYQSNDDKLTLEENEVLAVRQVHKSMFKGKRGLKVYSLLTQSEKLLPDECTAHFSTRPSLVRLHLLEVIEYLQNPFPAHAVMYPSLDSSAPIPGLPGTTSRVITICESVIETSLVASFSNEDNEEKETDENTGDREEQHVFDIPLDDDITEVEVEVLECKEEEEEHVYDDTIPLLKQLYGDDAGRMGLQGAKGPEYENLTRQNPPPRELPPTPPNDEDGEEGEDPYDTVLQFRPESLGQESSYDRVGYDRVGHDPTITNWMEDLQNATSVLEQRLMSIEKTQRSTELNTMQSMLEQLTKKLESVDSQLHRMQSQPHPTPPKEISRETPVKVEGEEKSERSTQDENKYYLSRLNTNQVLQLLDAMDLSQYKDGFSREHITGEILAELDDDTLRTELGMASKIHRLRLSKIVSGQHSAKGLIEELGGSPS